MVFVHARSATMRTMEFFQESASTSGDRSLFEPDQAHPRYRDFAKRVEKSNSREVKQFFRYGFGCHHAGMLRPHRTLTEELFSQGLIKVRKAVVTNYITSHSTSNDVINHIITHKNSLWHEQLSS